MDDEKNRLLLLLENHILWYQNKMGYLESMPDTLLWDEKNVIISILMKKIINIIYI